VARLIASFFGSGLILGKSRGSDVGSGTVGGVLAVALAYWIGTVWGWQGTLTGALVMVAAGFWSVRGLVDEVGDAGWIVIDEAAGAFISVIGILTWPVALGAFAVFRLADIVKTWFPGVAASERMPGATGVMTDDLVAGLYGLAAGHIMQALF
jgi:phosphatidylglycerophosphatase A